MSAKGQVGDVLIRRTWEDTVTRTTREGILGRIRRTRAIIPCSTYNSMYVRNWPPNTYHGHRRLTPECLLLQSLSRAHGRLALGRRESFDLKHSHVTTYK